ncbi:MAG: Do family serine endopeptidase [Bacteroidaceae bacterium]|nr:Do family serine endopeptidase [Bacteroidaceae bacterium]
MKQLSPKSFILGSLVTAAIVAGSYYLSVIRPVKSEKTSIVSNTFYTEGAYSVRTSQSSAYQPVDLTKAAGTSVHAVVHIKSTIKGKSQVIQEMPDLFDYFFGNGRPSQREIFTEPQVGYGSGVIISKDGYIVTNNHVIENADQVEATLNDGRIFTAKVIGTDTSTDLALIQIEGDEFPFIKMGNSDNLQVGEWVLAVGNPFNLTSTVTAGVVSAKARKIGIYGKESIESFIQTDAAINRGNSGGALVNVEGELVGINSAIESPTGTYAGYGFAIPTTIVKKVIADLKEFGAVQRALLGIMGMDLTDYRQLEDAKGKDFGSIDGVYVSEVQEGSGAISAGIKAGDVIISVDGKKIKTMTELQETIVQHRPGDVVKVVYLRDKKEHSVSVTLKNSQGNTNVQKNVETTILGATFKDVEPDVKSKLNIGYGMQIASLKKGVLSDAGIRKDFIILKINSRQIKSNGDIDNALQEASKMPEQVLFISGIYPTGVRANYAVSIAE